MIDQLTSWPIAVAIPDKEATTIAKAFNTNLILQHGCPDQRSFYQTMVKNFQMILWHMSVINLVSNSISLVHTHQDLMAQKKFLTNS